MVLRVIRPFTVKVIVTEALKDRLGYELRTALQKLEAELAQLELTDDSARKQVELDKRRNTSRELRERIKAVAQLKLGEEEFHSTVDSIHEVLLGDVWPDISSGEIVLRDGKVVEIR